MGTSPSVPVCLDAPCGAFEASARPGRTRAPDTGLRLRPVGPHHLEGERRRSQTQGDTNGWWSVFVVAASRPFGKAWTEADLR